MRPAARPRTATKYQPNGVHRAACAAAITPAGGPGLDRCRANSSGRTWRSAQTPRMPSSRRTPSVSRTRRHPSTAPSPVTVVRTARVQRTTPSTSWRTPTSRWQGLGAPGDDHEDAEDAEDADGDRSGTERARDEQAGDQLAAAAGREGEAGRVERVRAGPEQGQERPDEGDGRHGERRERPARGAAPSAPRTTSRPRAWRRTTAEATMRPVEAVRLRQASLSRSRTRYPTTRAHPRPSGGRRRAGGSAAAAACRRARPRWRRPRGGARRP